MIKNLLIFIAIMVFALQGFTQEKKEIKFEEFDITKVGQDVPDFKIETIDGKTYQMSELKGKTVMLVFFATWCAPCMKEMPLIETEIWEKYKSPDFLVIALGRDHSMDEIVKFNQTKGFTFTLAPDPGHAVYGKFFKQYIPRNVLIDKSGKIIYQKQGYREEDSKVLKALIEKEISSL